VPAGLPTRGKAIRQIRELKNKIQEKYCDRESVEGNLHCIIKELCGKLQNTNNDEKEVESALHGEI
jgi:hypothetical protein